MKINLSFPQGRLKDGQMKRQTESWTEREKNNERDRKRLKDGVADNLTFTSCTFMCVCVCVLCSECQRMH